MEQVYKDYYKAYNDFFGEVMAEVARLNKKWEHARILNLIDLALMTRDREWFDELVSQL